jgi:hypothetical protein
MLIFPTINTYFFRFPFLLYVIMRRRCSVDGVADNSEVRTSSGMFLDKLPGTAFSNLLPDF